MGRHYGMDWLRIGAFALLILYHVGMVFVSWPYHVKTANPSDAVAVPMQAINAWRLALLFVVSGYASRAIFTSDGTAALFAWGRTLRLIVPMIAAILVVVPPQPWIELATQHGYDRGYLYFWTHDYFRFGSLAGIILPTWQHLWFIAYLWAYTMIVAMLAAILPAWVKTGAAALGDRALAGPGMLAVPIALLLAHAWITWPGARETHGFFDDMPIHRVYFAMLLFGFYLRGSEKAWMAIRAYWPVAAVLAIASYAFVATIEIVYMGPVRVTPTIWAWFNAARAVQTWGAIVALIGIADRYWNHDHPWRAMLNEAVFPFYIIHQTVIVVVAGEMLRFGLHPAAEFAILVLATVAGCWAFYLGGRNIPMLRPLIGLRLRPRWRGALPGMSQPA